MRHRRTNGERVGNIAVRHRAMADAPWLALATEHIRPQISRADRDTWLI
jgi:hypothetical protein